MYNTLIIVSRFICKASTVPTVSWSQKSAF